MATITQSQRTQFEGDLAALQTQRATAASQLAAAEASFASARDLRAQRISELREIDQKISDRRAWLQQATVG